MSLDQVVNAEAEEEVASEDEDEFFFQDIDLLQNHGIVCIVFGAFSMLHFICLTVFVAKCK